MTQQRLQDGWRLLDAGDNEAARAKFSEAIAVNPRDSDALMGLGMVLARFGQANEALGAFKAAINLDPANPETHYGAAWAYDQRGEQKDAEVHARKAVALAPNVARYHLLAAKCTSGKDMETKLWYLEAANRLESGGLDRRWRLLLIYLRVFAGFAYPIQRLLMVWAVLATPYSFTLSATGRRWWFLVASLPFLTTSTYNLTRHRYHRAIWALVLCVLWVALVSLIS